MAKHPSQMTEAELAQDMWKRADSLDHLMAKAEMHVRRLSAAADFFRGVGVVTRGAQGRGSGRSRRLKLKRPGRFEEKG